jgi:glycosyltransferase involved in cell wall biosynthesis
MRVLQVHNQYVSGLGGEDTVVRLEAELLRSHGDEVRQLIVSSSELKNVGTLRLLQAGISSVWSRSGYESTAKAVKEFKPDVVHVHNTFPILSPSVYYAARRNGASVVQTLHNYRIVCTNGLLLRNQMPCEDCVGRAKWRGLAHRCYHGSAGISASVVAIQTTHRTAGTYRHEVDAYIALTEFQRKIFIREGLSPEGIHVKPNFTASAVSPGDIRERKDQIVFAGNVCREKGTDLLLEAWARVRPEGYRLLLLGDGPSRAELQQRYASDGSVIWMGFQPAAEVARVLAESRYIAVCSRWYETFCLVLLEAFSAGTPAIAPNHAAFPALMEGGKCGFLFEPSNLDSLAGALRSAISAGESEWREQSNVALAKAGEYGPDANYLRLMEIYAAAREHYARTR